MSNAPANCPRCGTALTSSAPEGLCPRCLGALNLATETACLGEEQTPAQSPLTPEQLGVHFPQLEIIECLGRGGMGVVYKARQKSLNRLVALKLLAPERVQDARFAERFTHEAQALAKLSHPNIVTIHDFGEAGGFYFLLMEFVDGVNLRQLLRSRKLTPEEALAIVPPLCDALQYAHERSIVHRDIKPENLLLDKDGRIKIADFGIAKMLGAEGARLWSETQPQPATSVAAADATHTAALQGMTTAGTPGYMAPEQSTAPQKVDARADIYSLGVVFYEMLTGELPGAKLQPPSKKVQIDVRLDEIVLRALEQTPELRYATAAEFRTQIETLAGASPKPETRIFKTSTGTFATPERLSTFSGQFFHYRTRGQLVLDERRLTLSHGNDHTIIPLTAIRDVGIGQYPRSMNPACLDLVSVGYEENGEVRRILISPMDGWFAWPSTWNARVAEWHDAIRGAVQAATGQVPAALPREIFSGSFKLTGLFVLLLAPLIGVTVAALWRGGPWNWTSLAPMLFVGLAGCLGPWFIGHWMQRRHVQGQDLKRWRAGAAGFIFAGVLLLAFLIIIAVQRPSASEAIRSVQLTPVQVIENIVVVDIATEIERWSAEVRAGLVGPRLTAEEELAGQGMVPPGSGGTLIRPIPAEGNATWRLHSAGGHTWRVGFVLPTAALAREAFAHLQPLRPFTNSAGAGQMTKLFTVRGTNGAEYRAEVEVAPVVHSGNSNWVHVLGRSSHSGDSMVVTWQVQASREGVMRVTRGNGVAAAPLQRDNQSKLHEAEVRLELHRVGVNRTLLTRRVSGNFTKSQSSEELGGDFRELSAELLRTTALSAKTVRGARMELGQVAGESLTAQVLDKPALGGPGARPATRPAAPLEVNSMEGGLSLFAPVVGAGVGSNEFQAVTTLARARHVGVLGVEMESAEGTVRLPELSYHAVALDAPVPFATLAKWTVRTNADGRISFQLHVSAPVLSWSATSQPVDLWEDYVWTPARPDRSHWVGPGEWNLNDTNALTIFEGVKRDDPDRRATLRLKFSLFALPENFVPAQRGRFVRLGTQWRPGLGVAADAAFDVTPLTLAGAHQAGPSTATHSVGAPSRIILLGGVVMLAILGGGVVVFIVLLRKRSSTAVKVLAVLCGVALLLFLLLAGLALVWVRFSRAEESRAVAVEQAAIAEKQERLRQAEAQEDGNAPPTARAAKFAELDTDQDGRLSLSEFSGARKPAGAAQWFERRDVNKDGFLTREEFLPFSAGPRAQ
jgi:serine/threonine protein kinase